MTELTPLRQCILYTIPLILHFRLIYLLILQLNLSLKYINTEIIGYSKFQKEIRSNVAILYYSFYSSPRVKLCQTVSKKFKYILLSHSCKLFQCQAIRFALFTIVLYKSYRFLRKYVVGFQQKSLKERRKTYRKSSSESNFLSNVHVSFYQNVLFRVLKTGA